MSKLHNPFATTQNMKDERDYYTLSNSLLQCEFCRFDSSNGKFYPDDKTVEWVCESCEKFNVIKNAKIHVGS